MKKILFVFGTRPEAIKLAPVIKRFKKDSRSFKTFVVVTAQHRQMLDQVLDVFNIQPDYDLDLMSKSQSLEELTGKVLNGISKILREVNPNLIFVQGDTTTAMATSLGAFYNKIPIAHIEAGLRTNNIFSPFPEEINRRITTTVSNLHFAPTDGACKNLLKEGIDNGNIFVTGNTVIDSLLSISNNIESISGSQNKHFYNNYNIDFKDKKMILITGHRRENFGDSFENICKAIKDISNNKKLLIIYPVHLNPNVQEPVNRLLGSIKNIYLIPPQDYLPFIYLMHKSYLILTDSGGVQEEAPSLGKPVLVMRENTERPEGIIAGTAKLVGTERKKITKSVTELLNDKNKYNSIAKMANPYGDGLASEKIYNSIKKWEF